ncbi:hypothetical protein [Streptomyces finlayi]|uniref:hypothetical protein n=1 Tax=Streptomyces finlayi TaxID=67296 RepID=UPI00162505FB|nr:hypothetical protein [Streptomyces finlayi]
MSSSQRGVPGADGDPEGRAARSGAPSTAAYGAAPVETVLTAAARASHLYTASAAQSAATALVRMFVEQGAFGPGPRARPGVPGAAPAPADAVDHHAQPTAPEHIRAAVDLAEARREAGSGAGYPAVTAARFIEEIIGRVVDTPEEGADDSRHRCRCARPKPFRSSSEDAGDGEVREVSVTSPTRPSTREGARPVATARPDPSARWRQGAAAR